MVFLKKKKKTKGEKKLYLFSNHKGRCKSGLTQSLEGRLPSATGQQEHPKPGQASASPECNRKETRGNGEENNPSFCHQTSPSQGYPQGWPAAHLGGVARDRDAEEEHGHAHPGHHGQQEPVPGVPVAGQPHLGHKEGRKGDSQNLQGLPFTPVVTTPSTAPSETQMHINSTSVGTPC